MTTNDMQTDVLAACSAGSVNEDFNDGSINLDEFIIPANHAGNEWLKQELTRVEAELIVSRAENDLLKTENANHRQEMVELHELIGVQRAEIDKLQSSMANINGYLRLAINIANTFALSDQSRAYLQDRLRRQSRMQSRGL